MTASIDLRNAIYANLDQLRSGSLSFWGNWFGKPYDNNHKIVGAEVIGDAVVLSFDQAETLIVDAPKNWSLENGCLLIRQARTVRWQWFYYGRLPNRETLQFEEYQWTNEKISFRTDYQLPRQAELDGSEAAVQLHSVAHS